MGPYHDTLKDATDHPRLRQGLTLHNTVNRPTSGCRTRSRVQRGILGSQTTPPSSYSTSKIQTCFSIKLKLPTNILISFWGPPPPPIKVSQTLTHSLVSPPPARSWTMLYIPRTGETADVGRRWTNNHIPITPMAFSMMLSMLIHHQHLLLALHPDHKKWCYFQNDDELKEIVTKKMSFDGWKWKS